MNNWVKLPVSPVMGVAKPVIRVIGDGPGTNAIKWGGGIRCKSERGTGAIRRELPDFGFEIVFRIEVACAVEGRGE